jgi:hypothetical protein
MILFFFFVLVAAFFFLLFDGLNATLDLLETHGFWKPKTPRKTS